MGGAEINLFAGVISAFFSTLLLASAWHKWQDLPLFRSHIEAYGLVPGAWADSATYALPVLEVLAAVLMWVPLMSSLGHSIAVVLLLGYAVAMAINVRKGRTDLECGCGGSALHVGWALVVRNVVMASLLGSMAYWTRNVGNWQEVMTALGAGILLWMLYALVEKVLGFMAKAKQLKPASMY